MLEAIINENPTLEGNIAGSKELSGNISGRRKISGKINIGTVETGDYKKLYNKPSINNVRLEDNKTFEDLGAISLTNMEIERLINLQG